MFRPQNGNGRNVDNIKDDEVKNLILESAKKVFQKWGLNKTTMEDIAKEAGKGKSSLYYYFKSKDEIFETLLVLEMTAMFHIAKTSINSIASSKEQLKNFITIMLKEVKKTISIYPLIKGEIKGNDNLLKKCTTLLNEKEEATIREILSRGIKSGEFKVLDETEVSKAANTIVAIVHGLGLYLFFDNDDDEKIDIVTKLISNGI
jgi:AcrR family transcriptional regulator